MKIYHNPRCRKSRETLAIIEEKGINPEIILYLEDIPTQKELKQVIELLKIKPAELLRKSEAPYKEFIKGKDLTDKQLIKYMVEYPKLIERPIVIKNKKAIIGRPPEKVLELI